MFRLNPALDRATLAGVYRHQRRVRVQNFLDKGGAERLHDELRSREDWLQIVNSGSKVYDLDRPTRAAMSADRLEALDQAVFAGAREGFQHRYEAVRVPDEARARAERTDLLTRFAEWLSAGEAREFLRQITGDTDILFADAQATAFAPGDFLTGHDDDVAGKNRAAAYVFGLTPVWRIEWGGLLLFHGADGDVSHGLTPRFNTLNIFTVPQLHSVSMVNQAAPFRRYSVTGWLRRQ